MDARRLYSQWRIPYSISRIHLTIEPTIQIEFCACHFWMQHERYLKAPLHAAWTTVLWNSCHSPCIFSFKFFRPYPQTLSCIPYPTSIKFNVDIGNGTLRSEWAGQRYEMHLLYLKVACGQPGNGLGGCKIIGWVWWCSEETVSVARVQWCDNWQ